MKKHILVVDDDKLVAKALARIIRLLRHEVTVVHSADEAKATIEKFSFDVVFSDNDMDYRDDGIRLRKWVQGKGITFYLMSGRPDCYPDLHKPADFNIGTITRLIGKG